MAGLKSNLAERLNLLCPTFCFACTFSKSLVVKKSELLKKPAAAFGAITKGLVFKSANTSSFTFHIPIAEGSVSSTVRNSAARKNPIIEFPFVPSALVFFKIGPEIARPSKS